MGHAGHTHLTRQIDKPILIFLIDDEDGQNHNTTSPENHWLHRVEHDCVARRGTKRRGFYSIWHCFNRKEHKLQTKNVSELNNEWRLVPLALAARSGIKDERNLGRFKERMILFQWLWFILGILLGWWVK